MQTIKITGAAWGEKLVAYMIRWYSDRGYNVEANRTCNDILGTTWTIEITQGGEEIK